MLAFELIMIIDAQMFTTICRIQNPDIPRVGQGEASNGRTGRGRDRARQGRARRIGAGRGVVGWSSGGAVRPGHDLPSMVPWTYILQGEHMKSFVNHLSNPKRRHTTGDSRRPDWAGWARLDGSPRKQPSLLPTKPPRTTVLNASSEAQTTESPCKRRQNKTRC